MSLSKISELRIELRWEFETTATMKWLPRAGFTERMPVIRANQFYLQGVYYDVGSEDLILVIANTNSNSQQLLLYARHCSKYFTFDLFNLQNSAVTLKVKKLAQKVI